MDDVAQLTPTSDFSRFVAPNVDDGVKRAAMKKLFSDPHFNVMDGLDTYIDDYGRPDPIPESMLRRMTQSAFLGLFDHEAEAKASPDGEGPSALSQSPSGRDCVAAKCSRCRGGTLNSSRVRSVSSGPGFGRR